MSPKTFSFTAGVLFLLIGLAHLLRVIFSVEWVVAGRTVPMWPSLVAAIVTGFLAYQGLRLGRRST